MKLIYQYHAINSKGDIINDIISSNNKKQAYLLIIDKDLIPLKLTFKTINYLNHESLAYRVTFFQQISILMQSGISLLNSLQIIVNNCNIIYWKIIISDIIVDIKQGISLSNSMKKHPLLFDKIIINLVIISEKTGNYDITFDKIFNLYNKKSIVKKRIIKSLNYPITLCMFSMLVIFIMLIYVFPQFQSVYENFDSELPSVTQNLILTSKLIENNLLTIFLCIIITISTLFFLKRKNKSFDLAIQWVLLKTPKINTLIKLNQLQLYFSILSTTLHAELSLLDSLKCTTSALTYTYYQQETYKIYERIILGYSFSQSLKDNKLFPELCYQLISIGEESGKLPHFVHYLSNYYEEQYIQKTEGLLKSMEPIIMLFLALLIGGLLLAMYLPIFNLGNIFS
ncbi:type II secretion system F family protein [Moellerella wisconsensis]|uniref:General secretion pathway protein F n=1 Tax=Moellerella wisconsensis TaxID=158849 RepID=A0A9Q8V310_9GAMM|nr:type II secretion system F family protein [Moellerella wisconsensis]UNH29884.1 type II secretion system F family protein [Moellerella wisconsensis]